MKTFWKIVFGSLIGCFLSTIVLWILGIGLIGSLMSGSAVQKPENGTILCLDFNTPVAEQVTEKFGFDPLGSGFSYGESVSVRSLVSAIDRAAGDAAVKAMYIKPNDPMISLCQAEEIRAALVRFRESGKPVISYSNQMTGIGYYLASVADKVLFNEAGDVYMAGMSTSVMFFKDALDKLGIDVQLIRHGKYKSAGETFTKNDMSAENRLQNQEMINSLWSAMVEGITSSRDFTAEQFNSWIDNLELSDAEALAERGVVDELCDRDGLEKYICTIAEVEDPDDLKIMSVENYIASSAPKGQGAKDKIAIVYCDGEIMVEPGMDGTVSGSAIASTLAELRRDSTVKAVVIRVNSPGGSAIGAELINNELGRLKAVKPVIASYGDYAASGGYWLSARADRIFTDNMSVTGSVGAFSIIPAFGRALKEKVGVNVVNINSNRHSDILSAMDKFDDEEFAFMLKNVEKVYSDFTSIVAEGRSMDVARVDSLGQGRIWTGKEALEIGFADELGGIADAVAYAEIAAGLVKDGYNIVEYPVVMTPAERLMESLAVARAYAGTHPDLKSGTADGILGNIGRAYYGLRKCSKPQVYARIPYVYVF